MDVAVYSHVDLNIGMQLLHLSDFSTRGEFFVNGGCQIIRDRVFGHPFHVLGDKRFALSFFCFMHLDSIYGRVSIFRGYLSVRLSMFVMFGQE